MHRTSRRALWARDISVVMPAGGSELVVEVAAGDAFAVLRGDVHVGGRQQVHTVGHHLDLPVQSVDQTGGEVDEPAGDRVVRALQVHDDGDPVLETVGDVARLVEAARLRLVDRPGGRGPVRRDRPNDPLVLGLQFDLPNRLRPLEATDLGVLGGGADLVELLELVVLDETEIRKRLLPHARHQDLSVSTSGRAPNRAEPTRTIVAPSSTATWKSSDIPMESSLMPGWRPDRRSSSSRSRTKYGRASSATAGSGGRVMSPASSMPASPVRRSAASAVSSGATPVPRPAKSTSIMAGIVRPASAARRASRSAACPGTRPCTTSASSATWWAEPDCSVPIKCHTTPSTAACLARSSLT